MADELLTRTQAAQLLHITTKTLDRWVRLGYVPKIQRKPGARVLFRRSDLLALGEHAPEEEHAAA